MSRSVILPVEMLNNVRSVFSTQAGTKGNRICFVVLSDEGVLAERISKETGLVFNPMHFAIGVVDPRRHFKTNNPRSQYGYHSSVTGS